MDLSSAFNLLERYGGNPSDDLAGLRTTGRDSFEKYGLPSREDELWKYTRLRGLKDKEFKWSHARGLIKAREAREHAFDGAHTIFFVDGVLDTALSSLEEAPEGVSIKNYFSNLEKPLFGDEDRHAFFHLSKAFLYSGLSVRVAKGVKALKPIHVIYINTSKPDPFCLFPRVQVSMGEMSELELYESYVGFGKNPEYLSSVATEIKLDKGAFLRHFKSQVDTAAAYNIAINRVKQQAASRYESVRIVTGGLLSRDELYVDLQEEGAEAQVSGLLLGESGLQVDQIVEIRHMAPHCSSDQHFRSIISEAARGVFLGGIKVDRSAVGTAAHQLNKNLLLAPTGEIVTKPQLEIDTDDVTCSHGATTGQLSLDQLFYLQSRGLDRRESELLLSKGFYSTIVEQIPSGHFKNMVESVIGERVGK